MGARKNPFNFGGDLEKGEDPRNYFYIFFSGNIAWILMGKKKNQVYLGDSYL